MVRGYEPEREDHELERTSLEGKTMSYIEGTSLEGKTMSLKGKTMHEFDPRLGNFFLVRQ